MRERNKFFWIKVGIFAIFSLFIAYHGYEYVQIKQEQIKLEQELKILKEKNEALEAEKERLQKPEAVEGLAREELGLVKPGEVPYVK